MTFYYSFQVLLTTDQQIVLNQGEATQQVIVDQSQIAFQQSGQTYLKQDGDIQEYQEAQVIQQVPQQQVILQPQQQVVVQQTQQQVVTQQVVRQQQVFYSTNTEVVKQQLVQQRPQPQQLQPQQPPQPQQQQQVLINHLVPDQRQIVSQQIITTGQRVVTQHVVSSDQVGHMVNQIKIMLITNLHDNFFYAGNNSFIYAYGSEFVHPFLLVLNYIFNPSV